MESAEYKDILASLQALTQRAYQLGRTEALKRVIEVMQADEPPIKPLALMAPTEPAPDTGKSEAAEAISAESPVPASETTLSADADIPTPWWSRPVRSIASPIRETNTTTH